MAQPDDDAPRYCALCGHPWQSHEGDECCAIVELEDDGEVWDEQCTCPGWAWQAPEPNTVEDL